MRFTFYTISTVLVSAIFFSSSTSIVAATNDRRQGGHARGQQGDVGDSSSSNHLVRGGRQLKKKKGGCFAEYPDDDFKSTKKSADMTDLIEGDTCQILAPFSRALGPGPTRDKFLGIGQIRDWCWSLRTITDLYEDFCPCEAPEGYLGCETLNAIWCDEFIPDRSRREQRCTDILGYRGTDFIIRPNPWVRYGTTFHCWNGCEEFIQYCCCLGPPPPAVDLLGLPSSYMDTTTLIDDDGECDIRRLFERDLNIIEFDDEECDGKDDTCDDGLEDIPLLDEF